MSSESVAELMLTLQQYYAPKNASRYRLLMSELRMLKAVALKNVEHYIDDYNRIVSKAVALKDVEHYIENKLSQFYDILRRRVAPIPAPSTNYSTHPFT